MKANKMILGGILLVILFMTACGGRTRPSAFYALNAMEAYSSAAQKTTRDLRVGVGPVRLPDYLNRPQIVIREGKNRLVVDEFHRWGGALEDEILRVLTENLGELLGSEKVRAYADELQQPDYRVSIAFQRFEGVDGEEALLQAAWSILSPRTAETLKTREGEFRVPVTDPGDYEDIVSAQSEALAALSREIAVDLHRLHAELQ